MKHRIQKRGVAEDEGKEIQMMKLMADEQQSIQEVSSTIVCVNRVEVVQTPAPEGQMFHLQEPPQQHTGENDLQTLGH